MQFTPQGYPECTYRGASTAPHSPHEIWLDGLASAIATKHMDVSAQDVLDFAAAPEFAATPWHIQLRYWFLRGQWLTFGEQKHWREAQTCFNTAAALLPAAWPDRRTEIHLTRWQALAAHMASDVAQAINCYTRLIALAELAIAEQWPAFIDEDPESFLVNYACQLATVQYFDAQLPTARRTLESLALPRLRAWKAAHTAEMLLNTDQSPTITNWKECWLKAMMQLALTNAAGLLFTGLLAPLGPANADEAFEIKIAVDDAAAFALTFSAGAAHAAGMHEAACVYMLRCAELLSNRANTIAHLNDARRLHERAVEMLPQWCNFGKSITVETLLFRIYEHDRRFQLSLFDNFLSPQDVYAEVERLLAEIVALDNDDAQALLLIQTHLLRGRIASSLMTYDPEQESLHHEHAEQAFQATERLLSTQHSIQVALLRRELALRRSQLP